MATHHVTAPSRNVRVRPYPTSHPNTNTAHTVGSVEFAQPSGHRTQSTNTSVSRTGPSWQYAEKPASFKSSARTQNRHTIHVAADAAGLLPICRPVSRVPLQSPFQRKDQPPSPFPLSVFPPPTWSHMGPSCPLLPPAPIFHDGLSAPHVLPKSPPFCGHSDKQCQY